MRATVQDAINERIAQALNIVSTDPRFYSFLNSATRRLLQRGKYWNTTARYRVNVTSQIFTLPPYLDALEQVAISRNQMPIHDYFFEFQENGWSTRDDTVADAGLNEVMFRGTFPTAADIATASTLAVKCDLLSDVTKTVTILGYDSNGNWVRTQVAGVWQDGEVVALAQGAGTNTVTVFSQVTDIQAPTNLNGQWWLYAGGTTGTLLGNYQYWDTKPSWKRFLIPFLDSTNTYVELVGKKAFIPVSKTTDYLVISNMAAVKLACLAVKAEEEDRWVVANMLWNGGMDKKSGQKIMGAIQELEYELNHHMGDGRHVTAQVLTLAGFEPVDVLV